MAKFHKKVAFLVCLFLLLIVILNCQITTTYQNAQALKDLNIAIPNPEGFRTSDMFYSGEIIGLFGSQKTKANFFGNNGIIHNMKTNATWDFNEMLRSYYDESVDLNHNKYYIRDMVIDQNNYLFITSEGTCYQLDKKNLSSPSICKLENNSTFIKLSALYDGSSIVNVNIAEENENSTNDQLLVAYSNVDNCELRISQLIGLNDLNNKNIPLTGLVVMDSIKNGFSIFVYGTGLLHWDLSTNAISHEPTILDSIPWVKDPEFVWDPTSKYTSWDIYDFYVPKFHHVSSDSVMANFYSYDDSPFFLNASRLDDQIVWDTVHIQNESQIFPVENNIFIYAKQTKDSIYLKSYNWSELKNGDHLKFRSDLDSKLEGFQDIVVTGY